MNVFIVEDSASMLKNMQSILSDIPGITVVGHAVDESGAIERINALRPDVVTLDLQLQTGSGFDVLKNIKKYHPWIKVAVLTNCASEVYAKYGMRVGADHFFDKSLHLPQFREVLREWARPDSLDNKLDAMQIPETSPMANCLTRPVIGNP